MTWARSFAWSKIQDGHGLTVRGRRQVPDGVAQRERPDRSGPLIAPPEDVPLEAAPVRLAGPGECDDRAARPCGSTLPASHACWIAIMSEVYRSRAMSAQRRLPAAWRSARIHCDVLTTKPATSVTTRLASRPATSLFRRPQRSSRSAEETRRARIGWSARNRRRSSASAAADAYRLRRVLLQALQRDRLGVARQARHQPRRRHRLGRLDLLERLQHRRPPERRAAGQQLVEDRPQRVDVGRAGRPALVLPSACSGAM